MKMAKASEYDLNVALEMCRALDALEDGSLPDEMTEGEDVVFYDAEEHAEKVVEHLIKIFKKASLFRVCFGMTVVLDPQNEIVDQNDDCLALNPRLVNCAKACEGIPDDVLKSWLNPPEGQLGAQHGTWAQQLAEMGKQAIQMQQERNALISAMQSARKWFGDGVFSDGLAREHWTPAYIKMVDEFDAAIAKAESQA